MRVLVRADAGAAVGMGHLHRCGALAEALRQRGAACTFLVPAEPALHQHLHAHGIPTLPLPGPLGGPDDLAATRRALGATGSHALVVDSYHLGPRGHAALAHPGVVQLAVDDFAAHPVASDLVVNGSADAPELPYVRGRPGIQLLLGPPHALLRQEFATPAPVRAPGPVRRILVTFGGSDPRGRTLEALAALERVPGDVPVSVVVGPLNPHRASIEAAAMAARRAVEVIVARPSMRALMAEADLAVSAGGQTLYELAAMGVPTVAVVVADNQRGNVASLAARGVVVPVMPGPGGGFAAPLAEATGTLLADAPARARMSRAGPLLYDGRGAERVAEALIQTVQRRIPTEEAA